MGQNATKTKTQLKKECKFNYKLIFLNPYNFSKQKLFRIFIYYWPRWFRQSLES